MKLEIKILYRKSDSVMEWHMDTKIHGILTFSQRHRSNSLYGCLQWFFLADFKQWLQANEDLLNQNN
uniref:Uncharacterized protein n=1 Tax=Romanomermis culicivorax TaxID=13658 RepID=A0A915KUC7_ROMCU